MLEVGSELGVLGLLALAAFVISVIVRLLGLLARGGENAGWSGLLLTLFVFSLVNAQFSGDVPYNSGLWLWGGIAERPGRGGAGGVALPGPAALVVELELVARGVGSKRERMRSIAAALRSR